MWWYTDSHTFFIGIPDRRRPDDLPAGASAGASRDFARAAIGRDCSLKPEPGWISLFSNVPELFEIVGVDVEIAQNVGIKPLETRFEIGFFNIVIPRVDALVQLGGGARDEADDVVHLISVSSVSAFAGLRIEHVSNLNTRSAAAAMTLCGNAAA